MYHYDAHNLNFYSVLYLMQPQWHVIMQQRVNMELEIFQKIRIKNIKKQTNKNMALCHTHQINQANPRPFAFCLSPEDCKANTKLTPS